MGTPSTVLQLLHFTFLVSLSCSAIAHSQAHDDFLRCLSDCLNNSSSSVISDAVYTKESSSYLSILQSSIWNLRFASSSTPKPQVIVTPVHEYQIPAIVFCSKENGLQIRTRSGGHDFEGLSYTSPVPFVIVDLINISDITVDRESKTAWVQAGATIGQLYYRISQESQTLTFPAGGCPTVGVGGHFSGGGYGFLLRKYGLAADNVVDARMVDVNGRILDRKSMGEDLFWAIRGGGGASFGVITAWKVNLVSVPETVTIFSVVRSLEQNATQLVHKWQYVAPNLPKDLTIVVNLTRVNSSTSGEKTVLATFISVFLGRADTLVELLQQRFPELGIKREDCTEVSYVQSLLFFGGYPIDASPQVLASRVPLTRPYYKGKSDYVQEPIPEHGLRGIWELLYQKEAERAWLNFVPYGGRMAEISESAIPFSHRAGNLFKIQHQVYWNESRVDASAKYINWIRRLYSYMTPYVSKSPRSAYINYRDLDIGVNNKQGKTSYKQASVWGLKYFNNNFERLVRVKTVVDPKNFFRNEQSIPPLHSKWTNEGN